MKNGLAELRRSFLAVAALAVILCGLYPLISWALAQGLFPGRANGSLIARDGVVVGSSLIGQPFSAPAYFHPRPSAAGQGYDGGRSGGTNLGPLSKDLVETVRRRIAEYRAENGLAASTPGPGRCRHGLGKRSRSPYLSGERRAPGPPRGQGPRLDRGRRSGADRGLHRRTHAGHPGRSPGERHAPESRPRRSPRCRKIGPTRFSG